MAAWLDLTLSFDSPIVEDLKAIGPSPEERLRQIGERVALPSHGRSHSYFLLAPRVSIVLTLDRAGRLQYPRRSRDACRHGPVRDLVAEVVDHWSRISGRDLKSRMVTATPSVPVSPASAGSDPVGESRRSGGRPTRLRRQWHGPSGVAMTSSPALPVEHWSFQVDSPFRAPAEIRELANASHRNGGDLRPTRGGSWDEMEDVFGEDLALAEDEFEAYDELEATREDEAYDEAELSEADLLEETPASEHPLAAVFRLPRLAFDAMAKGVWATAIAIAVGAGLKDVNQLTNMVFWFKHPQLIGQKLRPNQRDLARERLQIRDTVVRPALAGGGTPMPPTPSGAPASASIELSNEFESEVFFQEPEAAAESHTMYDHELLVDELEALASENASGGLALPEDYDGGENVDAGADYNAGEDFAVTEDFGMDMDAEADKWGPPSEAEQFELEQESPWQDEQEPEFDQAAPVFANVLIEEERPKPFLREWHSALPLIKFEFQTRNRIIRNDGKTAAGLRRKYGPEDYLVKRGKENIRLESESDEHNVLEFETEWLRSWKEIEVAVATAVQMTKEIARAPVSRFPNGRAAKRRRLPFDIDHLRRGTPKELQSGFWRWREGKEGRHERILRPNEDLEVEIRSAEWLARIQSSEGFLLHSFESYLRQHDPSRAGSAVDRAKVMLEAVRPRSVSVMELGNLNSLLQIVAYYIESGQRTDLRRKGVVKDIVGLMCRTSFTSIYKTLLSSKERALFRQLVSQGHILRLAGLGLDRRSRFFRYGFRTDTQFGPTIDEWLKSIAAGRDMLSSQHNKKLSSAMGQHNVKTQPGEKDRWLVKFETRYTSMRQGQDKVAAEWLEYARQIYRLASARRVQPIGWVLSPLGADARSFMDLLAESRVREALALASRRGIRQEDELTRLVFHSLHPEIGGRSIERDERALATVWTRIRDNYVRPFLR